MKSTGIFIIILSASMLFILTACGGGGGGPSPTPTPIPTPTPTPGPAPTPDPDPLPVPIEIDRPLEGIQVITGSLESSSTDYRIRLRIAQHPSMLVTTQTFQADDKR